MLWMSYPNDGRLLGTRCAKQLWLKPNKMECLWVFGPPWTQGYPGLLSDLVQLCIWKRNVSLLMISNHTWEGVQGQICTGVVASADQNCIKNWWFLLPIWLYGNIPLAAGREIWAFCYTADFRLKAESQKNSKSTHGYFFAQKIFLPLESCRHNRIY